MSDQGESRLRRRSVLVRVSLGSALAMAIRPSGAAEGEDATCDQAPELVPVQGCTDRDPNDAGRGVRCGVRRSCTDSDPNDAPGRGRRC